MQTQSFLCGAVLVACAAPTLTADITGACYVGRQVTAADGFGAPDFDGWVVDLFLISDDPTDTDLNVFNVNISNTANAAAYYQSFTGATWLPNNLGAPFETEALKHADSFVSMGGRDGNGDSSMVDGVVVQMNSNGTGLDPLFGGASADAPGENSGWYNSNPPVAIGMPIDGRIFIGRFALNNTAEFALMGTVSTTWNNGIGTPGDQAFDLPIEWIPPPWSDCNNNGIDDWVDIQNGTSSDCDNTGVPDECELPQSTFAVAAQSIPTFKKPLELLCPTDAAAVSDPLIALTVTGDFGSIAEFMVISLNDASIGYLFATDGSDCLEHTASLSIPLAEWNKARRNGPPVLSFMASGAVDPVACGNESIDIAVSLNTEFADCNNNGIWDACDIADATSSDCNANGRPDECDIADGLEEDCDGSGVLDICEVNEATDCNENGRLDTCEIADGTAFDCNENSIPDSCDLAGGKLDDNDNGIPDSCDLAWGDLDLDGCVDGADLGVLFSLWGFPNPPIGDLDGDGRIGGSDLGIILDHWGDCL